MKKLILTLLIPFVFAITVMANTVNNEIITEIETNMFGYDYRTESDISRLERIEKHIYGEKRKGNLEQRIKNIQDDTGFSTAKKTKQIQKPVQNILPELQEDSSVEYPIVDKLEEEVFKTTYRNENIYKRLDRLETKIFNQINNDDLNSRVDKLASVISPKKKIKREEQVYNENDLNNYYRNNGLEPISDQSVPFQLATLEQNILKNDYMNDTISTRLNRLEKEMFSRTFQSDSDITRLQRIMVAYDAKRDSSKYENNRKMQNMATASQLGGILLMILAILL